MNVGTTTAAATSQGLIAGAAIGNAQGSVDDGTAPVIAWQPDALSGRGQRLGGRGT